MQADVVLTCPTSTPIDFVDLVLSGEERLDASSYVLFRLKAHLVPTEPVLGVGNHTFAAFFDIPPYAPPSHASAFSRVSYTLHVHASVPWWPDRRADFDVHVSPAWKRALLATPSRAASSKAIPQRAPYVEVSYESTVLEVGGEVRGAVSVANTIFSTIRGVSLTLSAWVVPCRVFPTSQSPGPPRLAARHSWTLYRGVPLDGEPIPFRATLPRDLSVSFVGTLFEVQYRSTVHVDVAWERDVEVSTPVTIVEARTHTRSASVGPPRLAPVGYERRALVWNTVANRYGLATEDERMAVSVDGVTLTVELRPRGRDGLYALGTYRWKRLGINLTVTPHAWSDLLDASKIRLWDPRAKERFTVRAREEEQVMALLDPDIVGLLLEFEDVHIQDDGGTVSSPAGAPALNDLNSFVDRAVKLARLISHSIARLPPPVSLAAALPAWTNFANRIGGRLERGSMSIRDGTFGSSAVEIVTVWSPDACALGTAVRLLLSPSLEKEIDPQSPELSASTREDIAWLLKQAAGLRLGPDVLEAKLAETLQDPARAEPLLSRLALIARSLRGEVAAGPYR
jgi:hypothetical protein